MAGEKRFDRHRKEPPGSSRSGGLYRLLPQLVGSYDPGGVRVSGDGGCRPDLGVRRTLRRLARHAELSPSHKLARERLALCQHEDETSMREEN